jgi:hypothetical protein
MTPHGGALEVCLKNPSVANVGGVQSQGAKGEAPYFYYATKGKIVCRRSPIRYRFYNLMKTTTCVQGDL